MRYIIFILALLLSTPCFARTNQVVISGEEQHPVLVKVVDSVAPANVQLLQQIADNTKKGDKDKDYWPAIIAAAAAILGGLMQSISSYTISRLQLRGSTISAERLRWLHDAKAELVTLYAELDSQFDHLQRVPPQVNQQQMDEMSKKIMLGTNALLLSLSANQQKNPHQAFIRRGLNSAMRLMRHCFNSNQPWAFRKRYQFIKSHVFYSFGQVAEETWHQVKDIK